MPNPAVEIKDGAAAYVTAVGGVNVTPGATVIIRLISQTDVDSWNCTCITTDDSSNADTVTAALTIDATAKTATFTAPVPGKTYRFRSRVNGGIDRNGVAQSSYSTTFVICTLLNGRRMTASDETTETDSTFGWSKWMNDVKRSIPSGIPSGTWASFGAGSPGGSDNQVQYKSGSSFAGETGLTRAADGVIEMNRGLKVIGTAVATLANAALVVGTGATGFHLVRPVMLAPIMGGTAVFTGVDIVADGLADHKPSSSVRNLTTTNDTVTNVFAWRPIDEAITSVFVEANAVASGGAGAGAYARAVSIKMDGGVGTCSALENTRNQEFTHSGVGFTGLAVGSGIWIGVSGATGFVNVKGTATGSIKWGATVTLQSTSWA